MRLSRRGYTLVELVVVILIMGILASFGVPRYLRTVEVGKADDAVSLVNQIGMTNRMYALDHSGVYASGQFTGANCTCSAPPNNCAYTGNPHPACALVCCKYLADQNWDLKPYEMFACNGAVGGACAGQGSGSLVAGARRRSAAYAPYNTWAYTMSAEGTITGYGTEFPPPTY